MVSPVKRRGKVTVTFILKEIAMQTIKKFLSSTTLLRITLIMFFAYSVQAMWLFWFDNGKVAWGPYWLLPWSFQEAYWPVPVLFENILLAEAAIIAIFFMASLNCLCREENFLKRILIISLGAFLVLVIHVIYLILIGPPISSWVVPVERVRIENTTYSLCWGGPFLFPNHVEFWSDPSHIEPLDTPTPYYIVECQFFDLWCLKTTHYLVPEWWLSNPSGFVWPFDKVIFDRKTMKFIMPDQKQ
jgi:hypothetical protein